MIAIEEAEGIFANAIQLGLQMPFKLVYQIALDKILRKCKMFGARLLLAHFCDQCTQCLVQFTLLIILPVTQLGIKILTLVPQIRPYFPVTSLNTIYIGKYHFKSKEVRSPNHESFDN